MVDLFLKRVTFLSLFLTIFCIPFANDDILFSITLPDTYQNLPQKIDHQEPTMHTLGASDNVFKTSKLSMEVENLLLPNGILIDSVTASGKSFQFDASTNQMSWKQPSTAQVKLKFSSIAKLLENVLKDKVKNLTIEARDNHAVIKGSASYLLGHAHFELECGVNLTKSTLSIDIKSFNLFGVGALGNMLLSLFGDPIKSMNPILDSSKLPFEIEFTGCDVTKDYILLTGRPIKINYAKK